jgi:hypothetical protein
VAVAQGARDEIPGGAVGGVVVVPVIQEALGGVGVGVDDEGCGVDGFWVLH